MTILFFSSKQSSYHCIMCWHSSFHAHKQKAIVSCLVYIHANTLAWLRMASSWEFCCKALPFSVSWKIWEFLGGLLMWRSKGCCTFLSLLVFLSLSRQPDYQAAQCCSCSKGKVGWIFLFYSGIACCFSESCIEEWQWPHTTKRDAIAQSHKNLCM